MKIYVAGKFEDRERVSAIMRILRGKGFEITCDWTGHKDSDEGDPQQYCMDDLEGVKAADLFIGVFMEDFCYQGALVEMGIALGRGIPIWLLGGKQDDNIFSHHPSVRKFGGWHKLVDALSDMKGRRPAEGFLPGDLIKEELEERGWTQEDLSERLGRTTADVNEIITGKRCLSVETAKELGEAFGTGAQFWLNMESAYRYRIDRFMRQVPKEKTDGI